jgi:hypothetical protein
MFAPSTKVNEGESNTPCPSTLEVTYSSVENLSKALNIVNQISPPMRLSCKWSHWCLHHKRSNIWQTVNSVQKIIYWAQLQVVTIVTCERRFVLCLSIQEHVSMTYNNLNNIHGDLSTLQNLRALVCRHNKLKTSSIPNDIFSLEDLAVVVCFAAFSITLSVSGNLSRAGRWRHEWSNTFPFKIH